MKIAFFIIVFGTLRYYNSYELYGCNSTKPNIICNIIFYTDFFNFNLFILFKIQRKNRGIYEVI